MTGQEPLVRELDLWARANRVARLWWRDDDLAAPTPELAPLLAAARDLAMTPLLAVVPAAARSDLPEWLAGCPVEIAVHGWRHANHEPPGAKKSEFGPARPLADRIADADAGRRRLVALFGGAAGRCFVPPWNRMDAGLADALPGLGYTALSAFSGASRSPPAPPGLRRLDTHVDVIDWRGNRCFVGSAAMARMIADCLTRRRTDPVGADEPVGILSHHLVMTTRDWTAFAELCATVMAHPAVGMLGFTGEAMRAEAKA